MGGCKDCRGGGSGSAAINDVWKLYAPNFKRGLSVSGIGGNFESGCGGKLARGSMTCGKSWGSKCQTASNLAPNCSDRMKSFWNKQCDIPLLKSYETQPWFRNRVVQDGWKDFVSELVTPSNFKIGCKACPGPDDWEFRCHKSRALIGPVVPCVWELPQQDECATTQYGVNRDWRRFNADQRAEAGDIRCGPNDMHICFPRARKAIEPREEFPPYLGCAFGGRYMAWAHPSSFNFPRHQTFNYQARQKC